MVRGRSLGTPLKAKHSNSPESPTVTLCSVKTDPFHVVSTIPLAAVENTILIFSLVQEARAELHLVFITKSNG